METKFIDIVIKEVWGEDDYTYLSIGPYTLFSEDFDEGDEVEIIVRKRT